MSVPFLSRLLLLPCPAVVAALYLRYEHRPPDPTPAPRFSACGTADSRSVSTRHTSEHNRHRTRPAGPDAAAADGGRLILGRCSTWSRQGGKLAGRRDRHSGPDRPVARSSASSSTTSRSARTSRARYTALP